MKRAFPALLALMFLASCRGTDDTVTKRETASEPHRPWNVLLLTIDTLRADHLGCYGHQQAQTPVLDQLAAEGFLFELNTASNPITQPSHATILTGVYPMVHGVRDNTSFRLSTDQMTMAEILGEAGWATGAAIGGFPLTREFGTAQGFDHYDDDLRANRLDHRGRPALPQFATWYDERPAGHVNDAILPWLRQEREEPFFVWMHYWDPHHPHIAPAPFGQLFAHAPYDGEIAYTDASFGRVLSELQRTGEYDRTLIVVTSDHGEGMYEHSEATHAFLAYETTIRVPLIVRVPGEVGGKRIVERTGTVDIVPTILDYVGVEIPSRLQGRSLRPLISGNAGESDRAYYAESLSPRLSHGHGELRVLMRGSKKYIHGPRPELFEVRADPDELNDIVAIEPNTGRMMDEDLRAFIASHADPGAANAAHDVGDDTRAALEALGYLSTDGDGDRTVEEVLLNDGSAPQDHVREINLNFDLRGAVSRGRWSLVREMAEEILTIRPDSAYARGCLAMALANLGELDEAVAVVESTGAVSEANQARFFFVARKLFETGRRSEAVALTQEIAAAHESVEGWLELVRLQRESDDSDGSWSSLAAARAMDESAPAVRLEAARHHMDRGDLDAAATELNRLLEAHPLDLQAQLEAVRLLSRQSRTEEAVARLTRLLRIAPGYCDALLEKLKMAVESEAAAEREKAMAALREGCRDEEIVERGAELVKGTP
jgi:arylsulfatase A-like enzyme/tetratricopeptide (TPR) repeat protein